MAYNVKKVDVWAGEIADRPGGLASTLAAVNKSGANIEFVVARRAPDKPGTGVVFLAPVKGAKQKAAAQQAGLATSESLHSVRVEGPDRAGLGAKMTDALARTLSFIPGLNPGSVTTSTARPKNAFSSSSSRTRSKRPLGEPKSTIRSTSE